MRMLIPCSDTEEVITMRSAYRFFTLSLLCLTASWLVPGMLGTTRAGQLAPGDTITGKVTDILPASGIVYTEIDTGKARVWIAGPSGKSFAKGETISSIVQTRMERFHSKRLNKDFPVLYFVQGTSRGEKTAQDATPGEQSNDRFLGEANLDGLNVPTRPLSSFKGSPLIINVWASYCGPCRSEMGSLERLAKHYKEKAINIIGISVDDHRENANALIEQTGITFANYLDHDLHMEHMLNVPAIPLTVLVDADGRILEMVRGAREWDDPRIIGAIDSILQPM
jgi:thiol-disulfide isomerase/thioredoxin